MEFNGHAVRALRKCGHLTQARVAAEAGVSQGHIANVEAGRDRLNDRTARLVARALGLDDLRPIVGPTLPDPIPLDEVGP